MKAITREEKIMSGENLTPITRKELFLAKAAGQVVETPMPITREEMFLDNIQGGSGGSTLPRQQKVVDITENGTVEVTPDYGYTLSKVTANVNVDAELFVDTGDVEMFYYLNGVIYTLLDVIRKMGSSAKLYIQMVQTLPQKLILSNRDVSIYVYVVESTGIGYVSFEYDRIITVGQAIMLGSDGYDKGWTTDINSVTKEGIYSVRKNKVTEKPVISSFDNTGDGIPEVYFFSKELPTRFSSYNYIKIDAVKDITDNNGVHQEAGSHYMKYDEVAAGIGTLPPHVYCYDNSSANYLRYSFYVPEDGIYELAAYLRIKDEQLRGATYTINKDTQYEHAFVTTHGWSSQEEAIAVRDEIQGAYMSGMLVHLHEGVNTIHITIAQEVAKNQHFRSLYLIKNSNLPKYPYVITMDEAEGIGVNLAKGDILPDYYYISVTFNNGAPRESDGFCRVITSNGRKMSIHRINLDVGQTMPLANTTVTLRGKVGCVNSTVNGIIGKEARIFDATLVSLSTIR